MAARLLGGGPPAVAEPAAGSGSSEDVDFVPKDPAGTFFSCRTFLLYTGSGWLMSLAYLDPGNLESDLQSGAYTGYSLVWVLFWCTAAGLLLQVLAARLGVATGLNLAQTCRQEYSRTTSRVLWVMTEIAIIGSDVQEVLGSAIALRTLFGWPLWLGSLVTGLDTFTFMLVHYLGKRLLELLIFVLIVVMMVCFTLNWSLDVPPGADMLGGFVPQAPSYAIVQLVGTIGAVIMPHNIYLHSALVQQRNLDRADDQHVRQANKYMFVDSAVALAVSFLINFALLTSFANGFFDSTCAENTGDVGPLACVFHETGPSDQAQGAARRPCGEDGKGFCNEIGLESAADALVTLFGRHGDLARTLFALGVLAAGQASTMTGTFAGQYVMEGFMEWRVPMWVRTLLTRSIALGPAVAVALLASSSPNLSNTVNEWLNILQSVQLPFALLPVLHFNADRRVMGQHVLSPGWQATCWFIACLVIAANVYLVVQQVAGSSWLVWLLVVLAFGAYLFFISIIIRSDLRKLVAACRRWQSRDVTSTVPPAVQTEVAAVS